MQSDRNQEEKDFFFFKSISLFLSITSLMKSWSEKSMYVFMAGAGITAPVVPSECNQSDDNIFPFLWKRSQQAVVWPLLRERNGGLRGRKLQVTAGGWEWSKGCWRTGVFEFEILLAYVEICQPVDRSTPQCWNWWQVRKENISLWRYREGGEGRIALLFL